MTDNRGESIAVGDKVAYNLSGEIGMGVISEIKNTKGKYKKVKILVKVLFPKSMAGRISTVTNPKNVMVIHEEASTNYGGNMNFEDSISRSKM